MEEFLEGSFWMLGVGVANLTDLGCPFQIVGVFTQADHGSIYPSSNSTRANSHSGVGGKEETNRIFGRCAGWWTWVLVKREMSGGLEETVWLSKGYSCETYRQAIGVLFR